MKLEYIELALEVTRWCNLECPHCLRGEREKLKISDEVMLKAMSQIGSIRSVLFTGGEPSLAADRIEKFVEIARELQIDVENFYVVTNSVVVPKRFLEALKSVYRLCSINEISAIGVSRDYLHGAVPRTQMEKIEDFVEYEGMMGVHVNERISFDDNLVREGRARRKLPLPPRSPRQHRGL